MIYDKDGAVRGPRVAALIASLTLALVALAMWIVPQWSVWQQRQAGKARLAEAEHSRQIAVEEARALKESATLKAEAEVIRARGLAEANKIIADGLGGAEGYLRWLWIESMAERKGDTVYVPTEAGLPILEARSR